METPVTHRTNKNKILFIMKFVSKSGLLKLDFSVSQKDFMPLPVNVRRLDAASDKNLLSFRKEIKGDVEK